MKLNIQTIRLFASFICGGTCYALAPSVLEWATTRPDQAGLVIAAIGVTKGRRGSSSPTLDKQVVESKTESDKSEGDYEF